jgi:PAS domain S-box-containing protein
MQIKVLHVEDDSSFALVSKKILESENNFQIEIASSVKEAYEKLKKDMFDVIVSDFDLPIKDGLSFLEELVKTEKQPPFILFTGKGREEIAIKALNLGANGYVNKHGNPHTVYGELAHFIIQVVETKRKEKNLLESENKFRTVADYMYDWEYWTSPQAKLLFVSPSSKRLTGYTAEEFIANPKLLYEIVHPDDKPSLTNHFSVITQEPTHIRDFRIITKNGETRWLAHACQPVFDEKGNFLGRRISNRDITDRKQAEENLALSEKKWEATLASIGDSVIATDTEAKITFMNQAAQDCTGWPLTDALGKPLSKVFRIINENTRKPVENPVTKVLEKGIVVGLANHTLLIRRDGTEIPIDDSGAPITEKSGKIFGVVLVFQDISERKKAEKEIADLAKFPSENPNPVLRISQDGKLLFHNNAAKVLFEQPGETMVLAAIVEHATTVLKTKKKKELELEVGKQVFLFTFTPIVKSGYSNVYGLDVTEKKKMEVKLSKYSKDLEDLVKERSSQLDVAEHQLVKAERLAAIGELAGMIGHDLRNPLTGIKTSIYYLKKNNLNAMEPKSREMIEVVEKCIDHSNKIINDLLEYSKEVQLEPQTSTPETLISETVAMLKTPSTVTIINQVTSQTSLHVDFDKMKRVFSNLIKNSIEAMPGGGKVTITCKPVKDCLEFCVADTGPGIPPQVLAKIFTPLVTTKAQGMGFGLAICKRIVEAHDGVITVETGGKGTCFTVKVPAKH